MMSTGHDNAETPKIVTVGEDFYVRQAIDNMAWIGMGGYTLIVDALEQRHLEEEVFAAMRSTLGETPVRYLLNTHTHYDHTALNSAFKRRFGTEIVNQQTCPIGAEGRWFEGSRRRVLALSMPGCHTREDWIIWVPGDRVLFVGDIFGWGLIPSSSLDRQATKLLVDTYTRLVDFGARVVVPGHGPLCTTAELKRWMQYFDWLRTSVDQARREGMTDAQIAQEIAPPEDMKTWWRFLLWKHEDSLGKVLRASSA